MAFILALPWEVIGLGAASVERDEEIRTAIAVDYGEFGIAHFFASGFGRALGRAAQETHDCCVEGLDVGD